MNPIAKMIVATARAKALEVLPIRKEIPAAVTSAVPRIKCRISVLLNRMFLVLAGRTMLCMLLPTWSGPVILLADFIAFTRHVSVQS